VTLAELIVEVDRRALEAERQAERDGRGSAAEMLAATYRSARKALRVAEDLERANPEAGTAGEER
jgi:hypothetical protein